MACPQKDGSDSVHHLLNHEVLNFEDQLEGPEFALQTQVQTNEVGTTNLNSANDEVFDFSNQQPQSFPNCSAPPPTETQQGHEDSFSEGLSLCDANFSFLEGQSQYQFSEANENFQPVQVRNIHNKNNMNNQTLMQDQIVTSTYQATSFTPNNVDAMQKSLQAFWSLSTHQNPTMNFQTTQNIRNATSSIYGQQPNMVGGAQNNIVESESHATSMHPILSYGNQNIQNRSQPSLVGVESNYVNSGSHAISMYPTQLYGNQNIQSLSQPSLVGAESNSINSGSRFTSMYPAQLYGNQNIQSLSQPSLVGAESNSINSGSRFTSMYPAQLYGNQNIQSLSQPSLVGAESNSINPGSRFTSMYPAQLYGNQNIQSLSQPSLVGAESNSINSGSRFTSMYPAQLYGNQNIQSLSQPSLVGAESNSINSGSRFTSMYPAQLYGNQNIQSLSQPNLVGAESNSINSGSHATLMHPSLLYGIHNIQNMSEPTIHGGNIQCVSAPVQQQLSLSHNRTNQVSYNQGMNVPLNNFQHLSSTLHGPTMSNLQPQNATIQWPTMTNLQQHSPTMQVPTITNLHQQSPTMHGPTVINFQPNSPTMHGSTMSHLQPQSATTHGPTTLSFSLLSSEEPNSKLLGHSSNGSPEVTSSRPLNATKAKNVKMLRKLQSETTQRTTITPTPSVLNTHQYNRAMVINQNVDNTAKQGKKEKEPELKRRGPGRPPKRQGYDLFNLAKVQKTEKSSSRFEKDESSVTPQKEQMTSENVKNEGQNANKVDSQDGAGK